MQIKYCCTFWGCENESAHNFFNKVITAGYDGIEINLPSNNIFIKGLINKLDIERTRDEKFIFILQHLTEPEADNIAVYIRRMEKNIQNLAAYNPSFINSLTGKDYYTFDENCRVIEAVLNLSIKTGIKIMHETHRGRFSFHAASLIKYLEKFPEMELVGDFSHFCTVSESMLQNQEHILNKIIPHVSHIHARVGFEQGPQVNDPEAPEWLNHSEIFLIWWNKILQDKILQGYKKFTITPEYGPAPYMPSLPINKKPLSNQWNNNLKMMVDLKKLII